MKEKEVKEMKKENEWEIERKREKMKQKDWEIVHLPSAEWSEA